MTAATQMGTVKFFWSPALVSSCRTAAARTCSFTRVQSTAPSPTATTACSSFAVFAAVSRAQSM